MQWWEHHFILLLLPGGSLRKLFIHVQRPPIYQHRSLIQAEQAKTSKEGFNVDDIPLEDLLAPYSELDPDCFKMLQVSVDRKPWRLYKHAPLAGWTKGAVGLLGDAAHGMFPHQSQ